MSGGQQQRVGIARAFAAKPAVIFADEPTGNLDSVTTRQVLRMMLDMTKESGITFVMVTHENELAACADRIVTIKDGRVLSNRLLTDAEKGRKPQKSVWRNAGGRCGRAADNGARRYRRAAHHPA